MKYHRIHIRHGLAAAVLAIVALVVPALAQLPSSTKSTGAASPTGTAATRPLPPPPDPREPTGLRLVGPNANAPASTVPTAPSRSSADPTMPSPAIRELIDQGTTRPAGAAPPAPQPGVPEVRIRARVFAKDKPPIAVLEIAGKSLTVRLNSEIHIPGTPEAPAGVQLKVVELSPTDLRLEVLKRNQFISLN